VTSSHQSISERHTRGDCGVDGYSVVNRYYDPSTGQFLSVDPDVASTGQTYSFAGDDPVNASDPSGLFFLGDGGQVAGVNSAGILVDNSENSAIQAGLNRQEAGVAFAQVGGAGGGGSQGRALSGPEMAGLPSPGTECACGASGPPPGTTTPDDLPGPTKDLNPSFSNPTTESPGPGFEYYDVNGYQGWFNVETGQILRIDFDHPGDVAPHYDYGIRGTSGKWRWYEGDIVQSSDEAPLSPSEIADIGGSPSVGSDIDPFEPWGV
jgi:RHS repeat-associated protein